MAFSVRTRRQGRCLSRVLERMLRYYGPRVTNDIQPCFRVVARPNEEDAMPCMQFGWGVLHFYYIQTFVGTTGPQDKPNATIVSFPNEKSLFWWNQNCVSMIDLSNMHGLDGFILCDMTFAPVMEAWDSISNSCVKWSCVLRALNSPWLVCRLLWPFIRDRRSSLVLCEELSKWTWGDWLNSENVARIIWFLSYTTDSVPSSGYQDACYHNRNRILHSLLSKSQQQG